MHKYNSIFSEHTWQEIVKMSDEELLAKGVAALGARRKMLKVFENIKNHCEANVSCSAVKKPFTLVLTPIFL